MKSKPENTVVVKKPFCTGSAVDENTLKSSLLFFGSLLLVYFMSFLVSATTGAAGGVFRILFNLVIIALVVIIFFNNGTNQGADAVTRGEIIYQKKEKGDQVSDSEVRVCYHPMKGFMTALLGTLPVLILAVIFAVMTQPQMTDSGTLPSWMSAYVKRSDVANALIHYVEPEGMTFVDVLRIIIRVTIIPFVSIVGNASKDTLFILERLSPLMVLIPAVAYGIGYTTGKNIRTKIHSAIFANDKKRRTAEKKRRKKRSTPSFRGLEQLN